MVERSLPTHNLEFDQQEASAIRILAVIVLYKQSPAECVTLKSLLASAAHPGFNGMQLQILLYDNTPGGQHPGNLPEGVIYKSAVRNLGLADAYNHALAMACATNYDWLLTLDQDTSLPVAFLPNLCEAIARVAPVSEVGAIVPQICGEGRMISPNYLVWDFLPRFYPKGFTGIATRPTHAFNSASTLRVSALQEIGGYHPFFWLDYSDAYMYQQLRLRGKRVYVAGNIQVEHEFSLFDIKNRMSIERYQNIVDAGSAFWDLEMGKLAGLYHTASLFYRLYKHWKRGDSRAIRRITGRALWHRLTRSRARRIHDWKQATLARIAAFQSKDTDFALAIRPKISVCMASYNGERFIVQQLESILAQLRANDEIIIVDDASTDRTRECIQSLTDSRIRLIRSTANRGILLTFQESLRHASGSIVFLSDQDDLWDTRKVDMILESFRANPDVRLIVSDAKLIDNEGRPLGGSYYQHRGSFTDGFWANLVRCKYLGCTMAFNARLLQHALPVPNSSLILHDLWLGSVNKLLGGRTLYLSQQLVSYRRHPQTATGRQLPLRRQFAFRAQLLIASVRLWVHQCL